MKTNNKPTTIQLLITSLLTLNLAACDSEPEVKNNNNKPVAQAQGPATGILADTVVQGVSYSASSGDSGVTDATGLYKFNHGDSIDFRIGKLNLGKITGTGLTTPIELADGNQNKLLNLLILFQSLDVDNDPANGISIPQTAADALDASLDLTADPASFPSSPALTAAREAADIPGSAKTAEEANAHFLSQAINLLDSHLWISQDDTSLNFFRFSSDSSGQYLHGIVTPDDSCDANRACGSKLIFTAGVEYGTAKAIEYDKRGFKITSTAEVDTDLRSGLSNPRPNWRIYTNGDELIISDIVIVQREREQASLFGELFHITEPIKLSSDDEVAETTIQEIRYRKMDNSQGIVGAWTANKDSIKSPVFLFFPDNRYMLVDPVGNATQTTPATCAKPGVELASYAFNAASSSLKLSSFTYNTAGCGGLSRQDGKQITFKINADAQSATLSSAGLEPITLQRLSN